MDEKASDADKLMSKSEPRSSASDWPRLVAIALGCYALIGGITSFLGWAFDIPILTDWDDSGVSIQPNTTVAVAVTGLTLILLNLGYRRVCIGLSLLVGLIGLTAVYQIATQINLGINDLLMFDRQWGRVGVVMPGLMGGPGATSWTLIGTSLLLISLFSSQKGTSDSKQARTVAVSLTVVSTAISSLSLIGWLYGAEVLHTIPNLTVIAMQTATFVLAVSLGIILSVPETGPMRVFTDKGPAGTLVRRVVPAVILLPIILGTIHLAAVSSGFYDPSFGLAARTLGEIVLLVVLLLWTAAEVKRQARRVAEEQESIRQLANSMPQVVWISDESGKVHYYNERVSSWGGIKHLEDELYDWQPGVHPEDLESTIKTWNAAVVNKKVYEHEHRILMADGSYRWHLSRAVPFVDEEGRPQKWYGTATDIHDRKSAEVTLRESEQRFARFMQHLPGLSWIKDGFGKYVYANDAAQKAFQTPMPQLYGKSDEELFPPAIASAFVDNDQKAVESATGLQTVETLRDEDGVLRFSLVSKFPIPTANGSRPMVGGMAIDITEQKRAEANRDFLFKISELIRTARSPEELVGDIGDALGRYLEIHRCLFNEIDLENDTETVHRDYARDGGSVAGIHRISDYSPAASAQIRAGLTIVNRDSETDPRTAEFFEKTYGPNKELAYIAVPMLRGGKWVASLWCSDDKPRGWTDLEVALVENIAERTWLAVERLRAEGASARLAAIVNSSDDAIIGKDLNGIITSWNRGAEKVFGYTESEVIGEPVTKLIPDDRLDEEPKILKRIRNGESIDHYETVRRRKDGILIDISLTISPIFDAEGRIIGASKVARDITERKQAQQDLQRQLADTVLLQRLSAAMTEPGDEQALYDVIMDAAVEIMGSDFASMQMLFPERGEKGELLLLGHRGFNPDGVEHWKWVTPDSGSSCGEVFRTGKRCLVTDVEKCEFIKGDDLAIYLEQGMRALQTTPLISRSGALIGMVSTHWREPHTPTERDWRMFEVLAQQASDLIERRNTQEDVLRARRYAEATLRTSPVALLVLESDLRVITANEAFYIRFQAKPEDTVGRMVYDLGDRQWDIPELRKLLEDILPHRSWFENYEVTHDFESIGRRTMLLNARRMVVEEGSPERIVLVVEDITDRKHAEEALRFSEERYRTLFDSMDEGYCIIEVIFDESGKPVDYLFIEVNRAFEYQAGMHDVVGKRMLEYVTDIEPHWLVNYGKVAKTGQPVRFAGDYKGLNKSFEVYAFKIGDAASRRVAVLFTDITARKKAADALTRSEARSKLAQETGGVGIWDWDAATELTYWSDTMWSLYGEEVREYMPSNEFWLAHIHPDDRERAESNVQNALLSARTNYRDEFRVIPQEGEERWVESIATIVRDKRGKPLRMYGVNLDLTQKKLVEQRIKASETQLRLVTNTIPALVSYIDKSERYQFVNRKYSEWFGKPEEQFIGKTMKDILGSRAYEMIKPYVEEVLSGKEVSFDSWIHYKGAGERFVHVSYVPDVGPDGNVIGFYALVSDLSDLQRSTDLLRSSQERMRLLTESFTDYAIISTDPDGKVESWNPGAKTIFGYDEDEIIGESAEILFTPDDVRKGIPQKEMREARSSGRASDERWHLRKDGSRFFASGVMVPLYVGKTLTGYAKIAADLTERKRNAEALQRAHDEMEMRVFDRTRELAETNAELISEINERKAAEEQKIDLLKKLVTTQEDERRRIARDLHDQLGQRLTALRLKIASLREVVGENEELKMRTTRLQEIAELLDSEVSFLAWELRPSAIEELGLVDAIGTFVREWSRHNGIIAEFHSTGMANFELDPEADTHLYRIAQEALNNIVKHAEATKVNVLVERMGDEVVLIVEDNGKGFDRSKTRTKKTSKGLGLTGMEERASLIGGAVEIESAPDSGTTIFARVPVLKTKHSKKV